MLKRRGLAALLAAASVVGGCTSEEVTYATIPIVSAEPSLPAQTRHGADRLMTVEKLYAWCDQGQINLQVSATANTGGWREPHLNRLSVEGGTILFEAVAVAPPPGRAASSVVDLLTFRHNEPAIRGVTRVRVIGQSNEMQADIQLPYTC